MRFEYDFYKNAKNIQKHGIDFEEAITVFEDPLLLFYEDTSDSQEIQTVAIGISNNDRYLLVVHCIREEYEEKDIIRIISARKISYSERGRLETLRL